MILAVVGSRGFDDYQLMCDTLSQYSITKIISGGAKGADSLASKYAKEHNIELVEFIPDWKNLGVKAGFIRNKDIVDNSDFVIAFWDSYSNGTRDSIKYASKHCKLLKVIEYNKDDSLDIF